MTREERSALWRERVTRQAASGLSGWAWCAPEGLSYESFRRWQKRLAERATGGPLTLVRVDERPAVGSGLVVAVGDARIEVRGDFDPFLLRRVVEALGS